MTVAPKPRVLCVDDEPSLLDGLKLMLGRHYQVWTATGGVQGLKVLEEHAPFAAVVSDMRMPGMNGAEFLSRVLEASPRTVRLLLTGQADLEVAVRAINEGQIFRFLSKPCPPDQLRGALEAAVEQYRLVTAERELLERTLTGSVQVLNDVLALSIPEAFGRATRIKQYASEFAECCKIENRWQLETAAMLSQLGNVTLDRETVARANRGQPLTADEQKALARVPQVSRQLLSHIPRLEGVIAILDCLAKPRPQVHSRPQDAPPSDAQSFAEMLRIALDFDRLDGQGMAWQESLAAMRRAGITYDADLLSMFGTLRAHETHHEVLHLPLASVRAGMVLVEDVLMKSGVLLAARGYVVTEAFVERARNFQLGAVVEPIHCRVGNVTTQEEGSRRAA